MAAKPPSKPPSRSTFRNPPRIVHVKTDPAKQGAAYWADPQAVTARTDHPKPTVRKSS